MNNTAKAFLFALIDMFALILPWTIVTLVSPRAGVPFAPWFVLLVLYPIIAVFCGVLAQSLDLRWYTALVINALFFTAISALILSMPTALYALPVSGVFMFAYFISIYAEHAHKKRREPREDRYIYY